MTEPRCRNPLPHDPHEWLAHADAATLSPCAGRTGDTGRTALTPTELANHVARAIYALKTPAPTGSEHYRSGWGTGLDAATDVARDAVLAVLPAPANRTAVLREEAARIRAHCPDHLDSDSTPGAWLVCHCDVADDIERRLVDEAQQTGDQK